MDDKKVEEFREEFQEEAKEVAGDIFHDVKKKKLDKAWPFFLGFLAGLGVRMLF